MSIYMGPVLGFRGQDGDGWHVCVLLVTEDDKTPSAPTLEWSFTELDGKATKSGDGGEPTLLKALDGKSVWRFVISVEQGRRQRVVTYTTQGRTNRFVVPALLTEDDALDREQPFRVAYASCNGQSNPDRDEKKRGTDNNMWNVMWGQHNGEIFWEGMGQAWRPYHLLILGGDQLYADGVWQKISELGKWRGLSDEEKKSGLGPGVDQAAVEREIEKFYFNLYCDQWRSPEIERMLSSVPTLMMWDDHDIFDGWGSYPESQLGWLLYRLIYAAAAEHFCVFQLQATPAEIAAARAEAEAGGAGGRFGGGSRALPDLIPHQSAFSYAYRVNKTVFAMLDMRSERTLHRVMSDESREAFYKWISEVEGKECENFLLLSAIPLVYVNSAMLGKLLRWAPWQGDPEYKYSLNDDFADQWMSDAHRFERLRLINRLLDFADRKKCRVTVVSGDVHVGGMGKIEASAGGAPSRDAWTINQLISSPIVHVPNGSFLVSLMEWWLDGAVEQIDNAGRDITARMIRLPTTDFHLIPARNWLSLTLDYRNRVWAEWFIEDLKPAKPSEPFTKLSQVIYPIGHFDR